VNGRPAILPAVCAAGLGALVVLAGHAFAAMGRASTARVPVCDHDPVQAIGLPRLETWPAERPRVFQEAPMLTGRGLPPISERLPLRPAIIVPPEQNGPYGGTWARYVPSVGEGLHVEVNWYLNQTGFVRWAADGSRLLPDLAESFSMAADARSITFVLRERLRWSDGRPMTSDDVRFWWDAIANDMAVSGGPPTPLIEAGARLETPDARTVRFVLEKPNSLILERFAYEMWGSDATACPRHYLQPFHPSGRPRELLDAEARAEGFTGWADRFRNRWSWRNPDCPRMWAWVMQTPPPATTVVLERNPYYPKVDPEGRQLPYIDRLTFTLTDVESVALKLMRGDSAMQDRYLRPKDYPMLLAHQEHGGYRLRRWLGAPLISISLNRGHRDPSLRALMEDGRFARALSLACDRHELIELFTFGSGRASQPVPHPSSPFHDAGLAGRDLAHDPAEAARLLDALGCRRGSDGMRLRPDGVPLRLQLETASADLIEAGQVIAQQWRSVGVALDVRLYARELYYARKGNAEHDALIDTFGGNETNPLLDPRAYVPGAGESNWAGLYGHWLASKGVSGLEPPADLRQTIADWEAIIASTDTDERRRRFSDILARQAERRSLIGLYTLPAPALVVRNDMRNVPQVAVTGWSFRGVGASAPECFALDAARRADR
jgi:peptide/nickel transport system substrate-binding protein